MTEQERARNDIPAHAPGAPGSRPQVWGRPGALRLLSVLVAVCSLALLPASGSGTVRAAPSLLPNAVSFWNSRDGLLGSGRPAGSTCCRDDAVAVTSDGGRSYRVVLRTNGPVSWVTTAGVSNAWAVVDRCSVSSGCAAAGILFTSDRGRHWRRISDRSVTRLSFASQSNGFGIALGRGGGPFAPPAGGGLLQTDDGGRSWQPAHAPCPATAVSNPARRLVWVLCFHEPAAGRQEKTIFVSADDGRRWRALIDVLLGGDRRRARAPAGGVSRSGYLRGIDLTSAGQGLLWGARGPVYRTRAGGRRWIPLPASVSGLDDLADSADVVTGMRAFVLVERASRARLLTTGDGGRRWTEVRSWDLR